MTLNDFKELMTCFDLLNDLMNSCFQIYYIVLKIKEYLIVCLKSLTIYFSVFIKNLFDKSLLNNTSINNILWNILISLKIYSLKRIFLYEVFDKNVFKDLFDKSETISLQFI